VKRSAMPPSIKQMETALGDRSECFAFCRTIRRCIDCRRPVSGGPTRCMRCARHLERRRELRELYNLFIEGKFTVRELCAETGMSRQRAYQILLKAEKQLGMSL